MFISINLARVFEVLFYSSSWNFHCELTTETIYTTKWCRTVQKYGTHRECNAVWCGITSTPFFLIFLSLHDQKSFSQLLPLCLRRNHHGVSRDTIAKMLDRFELPISVDIVMNSYEPSHKRIEHHSRH